MSKQWEKREQEKQSLVLIKVYSEDIKYRRYENKDMKMFSLHFKPSSICNVTLKMLKYISIGLKSLCYN